MKSVGIRLRVTGTTLSSDTGGTVDVSDGQYITITGCHVFALGTNAPALNFQPGILTYFQITGSTVTVRPGTAYYWSPYARDPNDKDKVLPPIKHFAEVNNHMLNG